VSVDDVNKKKKLRRCFIAMRLGLLHAIFYPIYSAEEKKHNRNQCCELQALEKDVRVTVSSSTRSAPDNISKKVQESRMAGAHATMWIACRMPDWLNFGNFDLVSKQIEMAGARKKCFGDFDARIVWIEID
jgi:hypothetical protein